jgi:hypothetical protein
MLKKRVEKIEEELEYLWDALSDEDLEQFIELSGRQDALASEDQALFDELCSRVKVRLPNGELIDMPC